MRLSLASFQPIRTFSEATDMVEPIFEAVHTTILVHTATWSPPGGWWWLVVRPPSLWWVGVGVVLETETGEEREILVGVGMT